MLRPFVAIQPEGDSVDRPSVWIVDDSPLEAAMAQRVLGAAHETRIFSDGSALLELIAVSPLPDVLVLDRVMPGISGVEVCRFLRSKERTRELPILLLTVQNATENIVEG